MPIAFKKVKPHPVLRQLGIHFNRYRKNYVKISKELIELQEAEDEDGFNDLLRKYAGKDFFFFCYFILDLPVNEPFLIQRCYEIQDQPFDRIDLWARDHWKSTLRTFAYTIYELMKNPEERIVIFSHSRDMAKSHFRKIKTELEQNKKLHELWPHVFWENPDKESPKWNENDGLRMKRETNWAEESVEAWGLIDKQPTGKHFSRAIYDDLITENAVMTKGQKDKVERQYGLSHNLRDRKGRMTIIGTRYAHNDLYDKLMGQKKFEVFMYPGEVDEKGRAKRHGIPVYKTEKELQEKFDEMGEYIYNAQILQNPTAAGMQKFRRHWLRFWNQKTIKPFMNHYIFCDPAITIGIKTAYTCFMVLGLDNLQNFWVLDIVREKLELGDKWHKLRKLVEKYRPKSVYWEKNQAAGDVHYFDMKMKEEGFFFNIESVGKWKEKDAVIAQLVPIFMAGRIILPESLPYVDANGDFHDLTHEFIEWEYLKFPFCTTKDMLDVLAHILNPEVKVIFPSKRDIPEHRKPGFDPLDMNKSFDPEPGSWMGNF